MPWQADDHATTPVYRTLRQAEMPGEWIVAEVTPDNPGPAVLSGFKTEKAAQEAADTLNGLELDEGRTDAVLRRMMGKGQAG